MDVHEGASWANLGAPVKALVRILAITAWFTVDVNLKERGDFLHLSILITAPGGGSICN